MFSFERLDSAAQRDIGALVYHVVILRSHLLLAGEESRHFIPMMTYDSSRNFFTRQLAMANQRRLVQFSLAKHGRIRA